MRVLITMLAVVLVTAALTAGGAWAAHDESGGHPGMAEHNSIGLGFHTGTTTDVDFSGFGVGTIPVHGAPIGVRWWLPGQRIGIDAGIGFGSSDVGAPENLTYWQLDLGVPLVMKSWNRVHALLRPGATFGSQDLVTSLSPTFTTDNMTNWGLSLEMEAEVFLADNVTVSASHGLGYRSFDPPGPGDNLTSWGTLGHNFTEVGFHLYLWGPYTHEMMEH